MTRAPNLGATYLGAERTEFIVWAPLAQQVDLHLVAPADRFVEMEPRDRGYYHAVVDQCPPGARYLYRLDGEKERPDPASRSQPDGVHAPSAVVDTGSFSWSDEGWRGRPLHEEVIYELHVGTFSADGTFDGVVPYLDELRDLGVTTIELMPIAQCPGSRNWGYDGVYLFAAQHAYGGPSGLQRLVDACHRRSLAVILDVVYNHLGPEGNYLGEFAPYFTDRYQTPWGMALNFDGPYSDDVRRFFIQNALSWQTDFHIDGLRLDAIHAIRDFSAYHVLAEIADETSARAEQLSRRFDLIAESNLNDPRIISPAIIGGLGLKAQWADDFHHCVHTLLTGEHEGYYEDFGTVEQLGRAFRDGFAYTGHYSPYRKRRHGRPPRLNSAEQFVICIQNHDQIGNRMLGERLSSLVDFEALKLAAGALLTAPYVPLLFMGEEYGENAPFLYFTSHGDPDLVEAVRRGRREEFGAFRWQEEPPDPQDAQTFRRSKLNRQLLRQPEHATLRELYRELLRLRREDPVLGHLCKDDQEVTADEARHLLQVRRWHGSDQVIAAFNFGPTAVDVSLAEGHWHKLCSSSEERWLGRGETIADHLDSNGQRRVSLPSRSFFLLGNSPV